MSIEEREVRRKDGDREVIYYQKEGVGGEMRASDSTGHTIGIASYQKTHTVDF